MSLYGVMRTGASGMSAQATRLSTVADNVANVNTTGYKATSSEFSSLLLSASDIDYQSGSVLTKIRYHVSEQGGLTGTSSTTDLAISGNGFFLVANPEGTPFLTRAGSFVPDGEGNLVNAAGFTLLGYETTAGEPDLVVNGFGNLVPVNMSTVSLTANPSTTGVLRTNLPSAAPDVPLGDLPSANGAGAQFTAKSSLIVFDNLGAEVKLDIFYSKVSGSSWEVSIFDGRTAAPGGGFPYSAGPLATEALNFGPDGKFVTGQTEEVTLTVPGGAPFTLDLEGTTQLATGYTVFPASTNGSPAGRPDKMEFSQDGYVYALYKSGTRVPIYRIPLGQVTSPDRLTPLPGNVYAASNDSGSISINFSRSDGLGEIVSSALEQSTVDLAGELTTMIDAQRSYTANSKVFQTGSELMDVLVNLKR
jgi:flagellar hook protein FlgE